MTLPQISVKTNGWRKILGPKPACLVWFGLKHASNLIWNLLGDIDGTWWWILDFPLDILFLLSIFIWAKTTYKLIVNPFLKINRNPVATLIVPAWIGDIVDSRIGLSYRPVLDTTTTLCRGGDNYISHSGTMNLATVYRLQRKSSLNIVPAVKEHGR